MIYPESFLLRASLNFQCQTCHHIHTFKLYFSALPFVLFFKYLVFLWRPDELHPNTTFSGLSFFMIHSLFLQLIVLQFAFHFIYSSSMNKQPQDTVFIWGENQIAELDTCEKRLVVVEIKLDCCKFANNITFPVWTWSIFLVGFIALSHDR